MTSTDKDATPDGNGTEETDTHPIRTPIVLGEQPAQEIATKAREKIQGPPPNDTDLRLGYIELVFISTDGEEYVWSCEANDVDFSSVNNLEAVDLPIEALGQEGLIDE